LFGQTLVYFTTKASGTYRNHFALRILCYYVVWNLCRGVLGTPKATDDRQTSVTKKRQQQTQHSNVIYIRL